MNYNIMTFFLLPPKKKNVFLIKKTSYPGKSCLGLGFNISRNIIPGLMKHDRHKYKLFS